MVREVLSEEILSEILFEQRTNNGKSEGEEHFRKKKHVQRL